MRTLTPIFLLLSLLWLSACSGESPSGPDQDTDDPIENFSDAIQEAQQVLQETTQLQEGEPLNFRKLQEVLPEKLNDLKRTATSGQTNGAMGFKVSQAEGKYETKTGETVTIEVFDTGGLKMGVMSMAAWATLEMDREDDRGYERTSTFKGYKAFEKFTTRNKRSELSLLVNERFVIKATGQPIDMQQLKAAVKTLPLQKLL